MQRESIKLKSIWMKKFEYWAADKFRCPISRPHQSKLILLSSKNEICISFKCLTLEFPSFPTTVDLLWNQKTAINFVIRHFALSISEKSESFILHTVKIGQFAVGNYCKCTNVNICDLNWSSYLTVALIFVSYSHTAELTCSLSWKFNWRQVLS